MCLLHNAGSSVHKDLLSCPTMIRTSIRDLLTSAKLLRYLLPSCSLCNSLLRGGWQSSSLSLKSVPSHRATAVTNGCRSWCDGCPENTWVLSDGTPAGRPMAFGGMQACNLQARCRHTSSTREPARSCFTPALCLELWSRTSEQSRQRCAHRNAFLQHR